MNVYTSGRDERGDHVHGPALAGSRCGLSAERVGRGARRRGATWIVSLLVLASLAPTAATPTAAQGFEDLEARIWIAGGSSQLFHRGDRASVYYRAATDAYVAVFHIDTDGIVRLLHPRVPGEDHYVRGGRSYRLRFARSSYWYVDDHPGVGYFFVVASYRPMDFSSFHYSHVGGGWDLASVGRRVYQDPYLAMDDFVAALVPDWRTGAYALDFAEYHVDRRYDYPRFLCYDCHTFRPYRSWNPYRYQCHSFRLIVHTDPYFYPVTRYRGTRVVYSRPPVRNVPRFAFKERARGEPAAPIFRPASETDLPGVAGAERRRSTGAQGGRESGRVGAPRSAPPVGVAPSAPRRDAGEVRGDATRDARPGNRAPEADGRGGAGTGSARPRTEPGTRRPSDALGPRGSSPGRAPSAGPERSPAPSAARPRAPAPSDRARGGVERDRPSPSRPDRDPPRPVLERRPSGSGDSPSNTRTEGRNSRPSASPAPRPERSRPSAAPPERGGSSRPSTSSPSRGSGSSPSASPSPRGGSSRPSASPSPRGRSSEPSARPAPRGGGGRSGETPTPRSRPRPR